MSVLSFFSLNYLDNHFDVVRIVSAKLRKERLSDSLGLKNSLATIHEHIKLTAHTTKLLDSSIDGGNELSLELIHGLKGIGNMDIDSIHALGRIPNRISGLDIIEDTLVGSPVGEIHTLKADHTLISSH